MSRHAPIIAAVAVLLTLAALCLFITAARVYRWVP